MGKINLLEAKVFNMISAGEVVERPSSVVKELVENAIDAGATVIEILIEDGGIKKIQVSDNGIGIQKEDIRTAFLPHATSKLSSISDLDTISTLGFRGEALPSIASVSEVTLISCAKGSSVASKIVIHGGNVIEECADSRSAGTIITIENLFFNTPARLKFLKKPASEQRYVVDCVKQLALANPNVAISLSSDDEILLSQEGGSLLDSLYSIYGSKTVAQLLEVDYLANKKIDFSLNAKVENTASNIDNYTASNDVNYTSNSNANYTSRNKEDFAPNNGIKIKGYVSSVDFSKATRAFETIIVNGRAVNDSTITTACEKVYSNYFMKRTYPVFVLDIIIPFDEVDINVHPSKTEVRFRDKQQVFSAVYHAVEQTIAGNTHFTNLAIGSMPNNSNCSTGSINTNSSVGSIDSNGANNSNKTIYSQININTSALYQPQHATFAQFQGKSVPIGYKGNDYFSMKKPITTQLRDTGTSYIENVNLSQFRDNQTNYFDQNSTCVNIDQTGCEKYFANSSNANDTFETESQNNNFASVFDGSIVGQVFDTYLIVERNNLLYIIDQHAAHERILYDKIVKNFSVEYTQSLLIPHKFKLSGAEADYFDRIVPTLQAIGFDVEFKSGNYIIYSVPEPIVNVDFDVFLSDLFVTSLSENELSLAIILKDKLCKQACRAAIKGGEHLNREQIQMVLSNYIDEDGNLPSKCPHGRPAIIAVTKREIEKLFKRIV